MREKGFTLVELLLALAVGSVILTGAVLSIYSILVNTDRGNGKVVALMDINRAALAIKNDLLMAQTTDLVDGVPKNSANLTWFDYTSSFGSAFQTEHSASYSLSGRQLRRTYDDSVSIVGRKVTDISFTQSGKSVTVVISTSSNTTLASGIETLNFSIHLRSEVVE